MRLILRQQQSGPPPVCRPVTGVRPALAEIAVPTPTLSAYGARWRALLIATTTAEPPHLETDLKTLFLSTIATQWGPLVEQATRQRHAPADYLAQSPAAAGGLWAVLVIATLNDAALAAMAP